MHLSCTKGDLKLIGAGISRFVLGINSQLAKIDSNHRLSRIVRNLTSSNIVVIGLWNIMVMMNMENIAPAMVTIVMLLNDIPHVWHMLVANLEMNSYN